MVEHLLLATSDRSAGSELAIVGLLVLAAARCVQLAFRPRTHAGAALGLAVVLLGLLALLGLGAALRAGAGDFGDQAALTLGASLVVGALLLIGTFVGLGSLIHLTRAPDDYDQGRRQALAAVVLGAIGCAITSTAMVLAFKAMVERGPPGTLASPGAGPETVDALNFRYAPPSAQWTRLQAARVNPLASVAYARGRPQQFFMIIAEDTGVLANTAETVAEAARVNLVGACAEVEFLAETPHRVGDLDGLLIEARGRMGTNEFHHFNWVHARGGFIYQLVSWAGTGQVRRERARSEALLAFSGFSLLDPARLSDHVLPTATTSPWGYATPARPEPWLRLTDAQAWEHADVQLQRGRAGYVVVTPLALSARAPSLEDLAAAWGELTGRDLPPPRPLRAGGRDGLAFTFGDRVDGADCAFEVRVVRGDDRAYFLQAWCPRQPAADCAEVLGLLDAVSFDDAPAPPPALDERRRATQAHLLRALGDRAFVRREYAEAEADYRLACAARPDDADLLQRLLRALSYAERYAEALAALTAAPAAVRADRDVLSWGGFLRARTDDDQGASRAYAAAFAAGHRDVTDLADYAEVLWRLDRADEALAAVARFVAHDPDGDPDGEPDVDARLLQARLLERAGQVAAALALLEGLAAEDRSAAAAHPLVHALQRTDRHPRALAVCDDLVARGAADAETHHLRGRSLAALDRYREARAALEEALRRRHPRPDDVQDLLDHVAGALGEGSRAAVSTPLEPLPPPAAWTARDVALPPGAVEAGVCYLARLKVVRHARGEPRTTTDYLRVRVLDEARAADFNAFSFGFDPLSEQLFVNSLRVLDAHGEVVATGDRARQYVQDDAARAASQLKTLHVPVPGLAAGRTIELVVTRRTLRPRDDFGFLRWCLSLAHPVAVSGLEVRGDVAGLLAVAEHGAVVERLPGGGLRCLVRAPRVYRWEPLGAHHLEHLPTITLGDTSRTWEAVGREYLGRIAGPLAPSPAAAAWAREVLARAGDAPPVAALAAAVQERLGYRAVAFGVRAQVPHTVEEVLADGFGDCKDHALLLHQVLRAAGVPSALALVSAGEPLEPRVPSLDAFDHMVVYVPDERGGRFIDATDKGYALGEGAPLGLGGGQALVLDGRPRLVRIPDYPASSTVVVVARTVTPAGELDLAVAERARFEGFAASYVRSELRGLPEADRLAWAQRTLERADAAVRVTAVEVTGLREVAAPVVLELRYTLPGALQRVDGRRVGRLPTSWESVYLAVPEHGPRTTPFALSYPLTVQSTTRLRAPDVAVEVEDGATQGRLLSWRTRVERAEGEVTASVSARRAAARLEPPERWGDLADPSRALLGALRAPLRCR